MTPAPEPDAAGIAAGLTAAQRRALVAFSEPAIFATERDGRVVSTPYATAHELGVSGATLSSLNGVGGVDPVTLLLGPILVSYSYDDRGRRHWFPTDHGLAVRAHLLATQEGGRG